MRWTRKVGRFLTLVWNDIGQSLRKPKPIAIILLAVLLIGIGQIGLIIPIFPGVLFTLPGLILLSLYSPTIYRFLKQRVSKHPKMESFTDRARNWLINRIRPRQ